jgi:hypothetical protein
LQMVRANSGKTYRGGQDKNAQETSGPFFRKRSDFRNESGRTKFFPGKVFPDSHKKNSGFAGKASRKCSDVSNINHWGNSIQRMCSECEKEGEKIQRAPEGHSTLRSSGVEDNLAKLAGKGNVLPAETSQEMSSAFGNDFSGVRIHTDRDSALLNKQLHAQAFTHGNGIYFNEGKYDPDSKSGKHLLAHELTHVVQQQAAPKAIQRQPDKHDLTATSLSGDPILEKTFDNEAIIGKFSNSKGEHVRRIQQALIDLGIDVGESGADSKYGTDTENAVKTFQLDAGMSIGEQDGIVGRKTLGLLDMSVRNDAVSSDTDTAEEDLTVKDPKKKANDEACKGQPRDKSCDDTTSPPIRTTIVAAAQKAIDMINKVLLEQLPPKKTKKTDYPNIFSRIFRNNDSRDVSAKVDEVKKIYEQVKDFLGSLKKEKDLSRCGTLCDGGCRSGSPAYHTETLDGKHVITFCPDFEKDKDKILIVLHEAHHAAIPGSSDKAYAETRLFDKLDHTKALLNAASFHVYAAWVDTPGSQPIGPSIKDTNLIDDKAQKANVDNTLAFMHQWFRLVPFDVSGTVQGAQEAKEKGKYTQNNPQVFMELVFSKWFGLTRPPAVPNEKDIETLQAIDDRVTTMDKAFKVPFVILETKDQSFWTKGPGPDIALNQNVLKLDQIHMAIALLQELVHATPNISAESEALYVGTVNDMRNLRKLDP